MARDDLIVLFLAGDVMTGRGLDQAMPFHCSPGLDEDYVRDSRDYVLLAEMAHGPFRRPLGFAEVWGDGLAELERVSPDLRLINLETAVTTSSDLWEGKGINYRMHPGNVSCLTAAGIECCSLANNHVLDWGYAGLSETLESLAAAKVQVVGAGRDAQEAQSPAIHEVAAGRRILVFGFGSPTSGVPYEWAATGDRPGVNLVPDLSHNVAVTIGEQLAAARRPGDLVIASIHWGANWSFHVSQEEVDFAHALIDTGGVDVLHGHSSHHVKGIEVYRRKLILYGCGDLLDDYEGIEGHESYRGDLGLMYFASLEADTGELVRLEMVPTTVGHFRVVYAGWEGALWLRDTLNHEGRRFSTSAELTTQQRLLLGWGREMEGLVQCATGMSSSPFAAR